MVFVIFPFRFMFFFYYYFTSLSFLVSCKSMIRFKFINSQMLQDDFIPLHSSTLHNINANNVNLVYVVNNECLILVCKINQPHGCCVHLMMSMYESRCSFCICTFLRIKINSELCLTILNYEFCMRLCITIDGGTRNIQQFFINTHILRHKLMPECRQPLL